METLNTDEKFENNLDVVLEDIIDTDLVPLAPDGFLLESHLGFGRWQLHSEEIELFLSEEQKKKFHLGNRLKKLLWSLKDKKFLNVNVLDYLLAHQELIPESWKGKYIFFWGTIYSRAGDGRCVYCLYWSGGKWTRIFRWLDIGFGLNSNDFAATIPWVNN